jgi:DNA-binding MarR family transcriptional regulator
MHRNHGAEPLPPSAFRTNGRARVVRFLDAIDRARLTPMDVLLLLHVAEAQATVVDLANQLDRRPADLRRAAGRLVARGLLRRRADGTVPWGLVYTATASGLDVLARVEARSSLAAGVRDGDGRLPPRRDHQHRRFRAGRGASG